MLSPIGFAKDVLRSNAGLGLQYDRILSTSVSCKVTSSIMLPHYSHMWGNLAVQNRPVKSVDSLFSPVTTWGPSEEVQESLDALCWLCD